jgi:hypothetical protein
LRDEIDRAIEHAAGLPEEHLTRSAKHFDISASEARAILTERLVLRAMNDDQRLLCVSAAGAGAAAHPRARTHARTRTSGDEWQ